ncbi:DNA primase [Thermodesulfobacteriota bacterium]
MDSYQAAKEEIKRSSDIVELIGQYVQLKKTGMNHLGLCPFHSEKDPSFTVSQSKQRFHCFGCKTGGDIFSFWMEYHKVSFPQAMKELAERYHISLPERKMTPSQKRELDLKEILIRINNAAAGYYNYILEKADVGKTGQEYFNKRLLSRETISKFKLGYALEGWDGLTGFLRKKQVDLQKAEQAGLLIPKKNGGYYDRFRGRVIFPIFSMEGQVVGFGGRVLDDSLPKYLNTPETPVFHKGELLYGLNSAYKQIRETGRAVIVEGYTDVLALNNHGFYAAVATLGTALTSNHIRKLKGFTREVVVVFDSDTAGKDAAVKSLPLFLNEGLSAKIMVLPEGDDPDSFINRNGLEDFLKYLDKSIPMFDFFMESRLSGGDGNISDQVEILREILPVLSEITSDLQRSVYIQNLSEKCGISETIILEEVRKIINKGSSRDIENDIKTKINGRSVKKLDDFQLLNLIVHFPDSAVKILNNDLGLLLSDNLVVKIFNRIIETYKQDGEIIPDRILESLDEGPEKEVLSEIMLSDPIYREENVSQAVTDFEKKIQWIVIQSSINEAKESGDLEKLNELIKLRKAM